MYVIRLYKFAYMYTVHDIWCFGIPNDWGEKNEGIKQNQQNQNRDDWPSNISRHFLEASGLVFGGFRFGFRSPDRSGLSEAFFGPSSWGEDQPT